MRAIAIEMQFGENQRSLLEGESLGQVLSSNADTGTNVAVCAHTLGEESQVALMNLLQVLVLSNTKGSLPRFTNYKSLLCRLNTAQSAQINVLCCISPTGTYIALL